MPTFKKELQELINRHGRENQSDTPDFILAEYILDCLNAHDAAVQRREAWRSRGTVSGVAIGTVPIKAVLPSGSEEAKLDYKRLTHELLLIQGTGAREEAEEAILAQMDEVWWKLSDADKEELEAWKVAAPGGTVGLGLVDTVVEPGSSTPPRVAATGCSVICNYCGKVFMGYFPNKLDSTANCNKCPKCGCMDIVRNPMAKKEGER